MGTQIGVGISHHRNPVMAGKEAVSNAIAQAKIEQADFVMLFSTVGYRQPVLLKSVREATHKVPLIGCSSAGIIAPGVTDESNFAVVVMVIKSDEMLFSHGISTGFNDDSAAVGAAVGQSLSERQNVTDKAKALFLFLDGIQTNFDEFMSGLQINTRFESTIPIIGGLAGDHVTYKKTFQYHNDQLVTDGAVWALLHGEIQVDTVSSHGCIPIGLKHKVTKSDRNTVYEVDNKPVLKVLESYLTEAEIEDWGVAAVNLGWGFDELAGRKVRDSEEEKIIRCMIAKDSSSGSVQVFSDIPEGSEFWITRRDHAQIYNKADEMADSLLEKIGDRTPKLIFHVECDGRGKLIFGEKEKSELLDSIQAKIGKDIPWAGLYVFAEIGPIAQKNCLQNFAGVLTAFH